MYVQVKKHTWADFKTQTFKRLMTLTNRDGGSVMRPQLWDLEPKVRVYVARRTNGKIVGWATAEHYDDGLMPSAGLAGRSMDVHCYVDPKFRDRGIATEIMAEVKRDLAPLKRRIEWPSVLRDKVYGKRTAR